MILSHDFTSSHDHFLSAQSKYFWTAFWQSLASTISVGSVFCVGSSSLFPHAANKIPDTKIKLNNKDFFVIYITKNKTLI